MSTEYCRRYLNHLMPVPKCPRQVGERNISNPSQSERQKMPSSLPQYGLASSPEPRAWLHPTTLSYGFIPCNANVDVARSTLNNPSLTALHFPANMTAAIAAPSSDILRCSTTQDSSFVNASHSLARVEWPNSADVISATAAILCMITNMA